MKKYSVLGMMSGTSLDGLDLAHCSIWYDGHWRFSIHECETITYAKERKWQLQNAIHLSEKEHLKLHIDYGKWLGEQAKYFMDRHGVNPDFIASHGHTSHHRPDEGFTFQLGEGQKLAGTADKKVVCDFRTLDVTLGGQGAPLVPIGDELFFDSYDFCLNLGGISNISFRENGKRIAYDIGLANMPLNHITAKIDLDYDENGQMAKSGQLIPELMEKLNGLEYYTLPYPKSTGFEWFVEKIIPLIDSSKQSAADLLHTFILHNCHQIADEVKKHSKSGQSKMLVCGGGALNSFFMDTLSSKLQGSCEVVVPPDELINFKEALVFSLMGVLKIENKINVLSSVTGASQDSCGGKIYEPH